MCIHFIKHYSKIKTLFYIVSYLFNGIYTHIALDMVTNYFLYVAIGQ